MAMISPVLVALTANGAVTARRVQRHMPEFEVHGYRLRVDDADAFFDHPVSHLRELFTAATPIVALCSTGIVVRALAEVLGDKHQDPPVVVVSETAKAVVPLLGAHHGANEMASRIAEFLGVDSAVTTASDQHFSSALDSPPAGYALADAGDYKEFMAQLLAGESLAIEGEAPWLEDAGFVIDSEARLSVCVSNAVQEAKPDRLVIHPRNLVVGVGCERGCDGQELIALVRETLAQHGLAQGAVAAVVSIDVKADEPAVHAVAEALAVPARFFDAATLEAQSPRLANPSDLVFKEVGCHGVAEGAALAAADDGVLLVPKTKSRRATCAVAVTPAPGDPATWGRAQGELMVVGLGPGGRDTCTPLALACLDRAEQLVGYHLYLNLAGLESDDPRRHDYELGEERDRVRHALGLAAQGQRVALVCSGDPGIYAMASLVFEELDVATNPHWRRSRISVAYGTSAMQAAAALAGAPLGHDFCAISLSDLLTPWEDIERRIQAAAESDFVVAFYNPVSRRRTRQLATALEILRAHRPAHTPVVLGNNLGRSGQTLTVCDLSELTVDRVDMLTVVLVGSSKTRRVQRGDGGQWVYTPRGYASKRESVEQSTPSTATGAPS